MRLHLSAVVFVTFAGCAFDDGSPWGTLQFDLTTSLNTDGRRVDDKLKNVRGDLFAIEELKVEVDAISVAFAAPETAAFDPASPPDGFSLCHNGHCHSDDGRLVEYADVVAESSDGTEVVFAVAQSQEIASEERRFQTDSVAVDRGFAQVVSVRVTSIAIEGEGTDSESNHPAQFSTTHQFSEPLTVRLERPFGEEEDDRYIGELKLEVTSAVLDGLSVTPDGVEVDAEKLNDNFYEFSNLNL